MSAQNNDQLEEFFRKAAAGPEVSFNEKDWKKLEARLDAGDASIARGRVSAPRVAGAIIVASAILFSGGVWLNSRYKIVERAPGTPPTAALRPDGHQAAINNGPTATPEGIDAPGSAVDVTAASIQEGSTVDEVIDATSEIKNKNAGNDLPADAPSNNIMPPHAEAEHPTARYVQASMASLNNKKIAGEFRGNSPSMSVKIKQKAVVDLPGAEEGDRREARANVSVEHASVQKQHLAAPRLSLLLSFAPDFSGTSIGEYSAPGKAFGASLAYQFGKRWRVSVGAIKNYKEYTGSGEYYKPPKGYWKRNTNGIVPSTIDGSCSLVEFPIMIQYYMIDHGKNKWVVGAGASSYLMQTESYRYNFEQANPGAKDGWQSNERSHFMFNMINFTVGYEHEILPGVVIGIEPYVKIPIEEIGWSHLKLFSTGASITMRYTLLHRASKTMVKESRPPD